MNYIKCFELFDFNKSSDRFNTELTEFSIDSNSYGCGVWADDDNNTLSLQINYDAGTDSSSIKFKINNKTDKEFISSYRRVNADLGYYIDIFTKIKPYIEEYAKKVNPSKISIITASPKKINIYNYIISKLIAKLYNVEILDISNDDVKKYKILLTRN